MAAHDVSERYALIGAGPCGLAMARQLRRFGIPFQGFELHSGVGGLWDIANPTSPVYESAHLITSKAATEFDELPMGDAVADYPDHRVVRDYLDRYARQFDLHQHYRFNAEVVRCEPVDGGGWTVRWRDRDSGEASSERFAGVLVANGTFHEPNRPSFPGSFDGDLFHAVDYKSPERFADRRVLVIGGGNTGCDIVVDAVGIAAEVSISIRRGYYFAPKYIFGKPSAKAASIVPMPRWLKQRIDAFVLGLLVPDPTRFGFPKPDYPLYEIGPVVNTQILHHAGHGHVDVRPNIERFDGRTVHFADGSSADYDTVVLATGYRLHYPFLDPELLNWSDPAASTAPRLFLNCFHPERDDLFVLGMVESGGVGFEGRNEQAELVARFLSEAGKGSAKADTFRRAKAGPMPDLRGGWSYKQLDRHAFYVHKDTWRGLLRQHIAALS
ncbi:MAG: NAD(P)/FAD-dependent oxidoreductase [Acidobacteriota bacterium]